MSHHPERTARNVRPVNQPPSFRKESSGRCDQMVVRPNAKAAKTLTPQCDLSPIWNLCLQQHANAVRNTHPDAVRTPRLLWPRPTPRFAFASARSPKFLSELSTRVPRLYPVRSIRPMSFADARYWLHPIGETGQRIATFTRLRHTVHLRWNSCLRQIRLPHVSRLPHGLSSYSHFDIYMRLAPFG